MRLTEKKLEERIDELSKYRYRNMSKINSFHTIEDDGKIGLYPPIIGEKHQEISLGDRWEGRDVYKWLQTEVTFPLESNAMEIVGRFKFGRTSIGTNVGFESLLFVNGRPFQGVDANHTEVLFESTLSGKKATLEFRMWTGLEGGGKPEVQHYLLEQAEIGLLDEKVDDLYFISLAMHQTITELDTNEPIRVDLLKILDETFLKLDWSVPGSEDFYESCYDAHIFISDHVEKFEKNSPVTINCVGHTHIDVAWLWRLKHTREKIARSFSTVLNLMNQYPDYQFLQSQPQLYEYIKEDYPEIFEKMKKRIQEGRWETEGSMWLEADCNIPSGESLVRQILVGKQFLKKEFSKDCSVLWLPDVFGYSWALPQILRKSGIHSFMTTKISWNQYNRMPHDTFYWKGIDGSKILTHFITTPETWSKPDSWFYTYNGFLTAKTLNGAWKAYRNKDINKNLLVSYGHGDGGGGVNREMLEMRRHLDRIPGIPHIKPGSAGQFFEKLHETIESTNQYVHEWDGELYLEYHRGTYTSQASVKRHNRKLEIALRELEFLSVLNALEQDWSKYPEESILKAWKIVLRNQFHDIIPGSSIREVYEDAEIEYNEAWQLCRENLDKVTHRLINKDVPKYTLLNTSSIEDGHLVFIPYDSNNTRVGVFELSSGDLVASQATENGHFVYVDWLPQFGSDTLTFNTNREPSSSEDGLDFQYEEGILNTPFYIVKWNENGQLTSLFDKHAKREVLAENEVGNSLQVFEDKPLAHDAWDIDIFYQEKMKQVTNLTSMEIVENGSLRIVFRFNWKYKSSQILQDVVFYKNSKRIDFETKIDWHERNQLLKASFPVDIRSTEATFDIQYGNVKRPTNWNTSWEWAKFETVGHQWADLSETGYGVSILNDCKYGHDIKGNRIRLTLIKSAIDPDFEADQGKHVFTYSLYPHLGDWREGKTHELAWALNSPVKVLSGHLESNLKSLFKFDIQSVHVDAIKKAEHGDGVILRFHEYEGRRSDVEITSDYPIASWVEVDLMENVISEESTVSKINLSITPYEIKTFMVKFK